MEGEAIGQTDRQTQTDGRGDSESGSQLAGRRVFTRFRLFHSNDIVLSVACWMKRKTETKIKNTKPQTKFCGNFAVGFAQCQWQQIINNIFFWAKFVQFSLSCIWFVQIEFLDFTCIPIILILAILDKHSCFSTDIDILRLFSLFPYKRTNPRTIRACSGYIALKICKCIKKWL